MKKTLNLMVWVIYLHALFVCIVLKRFKYGHFSITYVRAIIMQPVAFLHASRYVGGGSWSR